MTALHAAMADVPAMHDPTRCPIAINDTQQRATPASPARLVLAQCSSSERSADGVRSMASRAMPGDPPRAQQSNTDQQMSWRKPLVVDYELANRLQRRRGYTEQYPLGTPAEREAADLPPRDMPRDTTPVAVTHEQAPRLRRPLPLAPWKRSAKPLRKDRNRAVARFLKPSAGLEPATPSLPWRSLYCGGSSPGG